MKFTIQYKLPTLNDYQNACRSNPYVGAKLKKDTDEVIGLFIRKALAEHSISPTDKRHDFRFIWTEKTARRDHDNISSAVKFIFDALQQTGVIPNDSWKFVGDISHSFRLGDEYSVTVKMIETMPFEKNIKKIIKNT